MKLIVVRHGISISNEKEINASVYEKYDGGLVEEGKEQAQKLMLELKNYNFNNIIVSPLKRTIETIRPYLDTLDNPSVIKLDLVTERDLGDLAGTKTGEIKEFYEKNNVIDKVSWIPPNGEAVMEVYNRAKKFLNWLKENCDKDDTILLCSHSGFIRCLTVLINKGDINKFYDQNIPENAKIKIFEF